jgi:hypothetical protein
VADEQVRRDHLISQVLAAISASRADDVVSFGGTALSRTHLARARLSEDVDLIATTKRSEVRPRHVRALGRALMRPHGRCATTTLAERTSNHPDVGSSRTVTR